VYRTLFNGDRTLWNGDSWVYITLLSKGQKVFCSI